GRLIGRWKQEAIAANAGASDEDLARIVSDMARKQGYAYTITPEKVRAKSKKTRRNKSARRAAAAPAARSTPAPAPAAAAGGISLEDLRAVKEVVDRIGAGSVQELTRVLSG